MRTSPVPAQALFEYPEIDFDAPIVDQAGIGEINPHRGPMVQLDGIGWWSDGKGVGFRNIKSDEFWVDGHIPGRPLLPGVLMIEAAAQLSSYVQQMSHPELQESFLGFTRCDDCAFRGQVVPGDRLIFLAAMEKQNRRRFVSKCQGFVGDALVFEAKITGMAF